MMHLRYPHKRDFCTWDELSCLSRALGFQPDTIKRCVPDEITETEPGLSFKMVQKLIDLKYFNDALDVSINMHSADYNINSVLKGLKLLNHRLLSFTELHDVRVAFQVYEAGDMRGMMIDQHTLIRTLKLCGRTIAPMKLMHRVKHMQEDFDEPGRIQLYEFLDLIVLCEQADDIDVPESKRGPLDKTWRKLFELDDFQRVCATNDEKLLNHLNEEFKNTELNYGHEQLGSKRIPRESAVDTSVRKTQVRFHGKRYKQLHNYLGQSKATVQHAKAGCIRERPTTVPDVGDFRFPAKSPIPQLQRSQTAAQDDISLTPFMEDPRIKLLQAIYDRKVLQSAPCGPMSSPSPNPRVTFADPIRNIRTAPSENSSPLGRPWQAKGPDAPRPQTTAVASEQDILERQNILDALNYEIETLEERRMQKLKEQIRQHLPRFNLESLSDKNKTAPGAPPKKQKQRRERQPSPEAMRRLSIPKFKRIPLGSHSKNCDALTQMGTKMSERKLKTKKKSEKAVNLKPLVLLDGRRCSDITETVNEEEPGAHSLDAKDDLKDEKGNMVETASTLSSRTVESSIALKSLDLIPPTYHGRLRHHQIQPTKDPEKFKSARVGAAAVLYNHFNVGEKPISNQKQESVPEHNRKGRRQSSSEEKSLSSSSHVMEALIVPSLRNEESQVNNNNLNKSNNEFKVDSGKLTEDAHKSRTIPNSASSMDDELRINGMTLSEMIKSKPKERDDDDDR